MVVYTLEQRCEILRHYFCRFCQKKIIFSDEAHFDPGGYVNKILVFGAQKTHTYTLKSRRTQNESLFGFGFWSRGIIGPFFFQNEQGEAATVNGDRYRAMLNEFLFIKIEVEDIDIWFQQDGATCHTAKTTFDVLSPVFEDRIISRRADVVWPPRSCDLTPLDYYLWRRRQAKDN